MTKKDITIEEGSIVLRWYSPDDEDGSPALVMTNRKDEAMLGGVTHAELDHTKIPEMAKAFSLLAAELSALPPSDSKAYVEERDLGRTDHEDGGVLRLERDEIRYEATKAGMPDRCPICGYGMSAGRIELNEIGRRQARYAYYWSCDAEGCCYQGGRS